MMVLERWMVAVILVVGLVSTAGAAPGQSSSANSQTAQPDAKAPAPDQATPDKPAADQSTDDQTTDDGDIEDHPRPYKRDPIPPDLTKAEQAPPPAPDKSAAGQTTPSQATPEKPAADQPTPKPATPERPAIEQALSNQVTPPVPPPPGSPEEQQLRKDSAHLLQLVQELRVEVQKAGNDTLSLAAVRKADEVQKLSKSIKARMKEWGLVPQGKGQ